MIQHVNQTRKTTLVIIVLAIGLIVTFFLSLNLGMVKISPGEVFKVFMGSGSAQNQIILFDFRLPRMVIALLIGAGIAVSGAILQSVSQNGLADPGILGINS